MIWTEVLLLPAKNPQYHGVSRVPHTTLTALAKRYFCTQMAGQAEGTQDAKPLDLAYFLHCSTQPYGRDDARDWDLSVTEAVVKALACGDVPKGVRHAMEPSGHQSDRHIWRYVTLDGQRLADALDAPDDLAGTRSRGDAPRHRRHTAGEPPTEVASPRTNRRAMYVTAHDN
jgi:hypothetical protein